MALDRHVYRGAVSAAVARRNVDRMLEARGKRRWTAAEDAKVRALYPDYRALRRALRRRTYNALRSRAATLGIRKRRHRWMTGDLRTLRQALQAGRTMREAAAILGLRLEQVKGAMKMHRIRVPRRPLLRSRNPMLDAIRQRPWALNVSLSDLDRATGVRLFAKSQVGREVSLRVARKAMKVLGGRMRIEWEAVD